MLRYFRMPEGLRDLSKLFGGGTPEEPPKTQAEGGDGGKVPPEVTLAEPPDEEPKRQISTGEIESAGIDDGREDEADQQEAA